MSERTRRIDHLLREEISAIIRRDLGDPRLGFVTITGVEVAPDLRHATVWASILGSEKERQATLQVLGRAMPFVRHQLGSLRLRRIPELHLREDDSSQRSTRVMRILEQIETEPGEEGQEQRSTGCWRRRRSCPHRPGPGMCRSMRRRTRPRRRSPRCRRAIVGAWTVTPCAARGSAVVAEGQPVLRSLRPSDLEVVPPAVPAALLAGRRVMTVCHRDPEADALGSALSVALALEALGARVNAVCADPVPAMYDFMPHIGRFRQAPEADLDPDLIVVCDCGDLARIGSVLTDNADLFARVPIVDIDHHVSNTGFGAIDWVDAQAAATCEQVTLLLPHLGLPFDALDGALAENLTAGLVIDTANFAHPNTTPRTLRVGSELLAAGARLPDIARRIYRSKPNAQLRLFGRVLARLEQSADGRIVWSVMTDDDIASAGAEHADVRRAHRPAGAVRERRGRRPLQGPGRAHTHLGAHARRWRGRDAR